MPGDGDLPARQSTVVDVAPEVRVDPLQSAWVETDLVWIDLIHEL